MYVTSPPPEHMSYDEFLAWLGDDKHAEWVCGSVVFHGSVTRRHSLIGGFLLSLLGLFIEQHDLGEMHRTPFQMRASPDLPSRAPDILFVAKERLGLIQANGLNGPADLVVEIVSPESRSRDRGEKYGEYERGGVREYWIIDHERQTAEFNRLGPEGRYLLAPVDADGWFESAVLPGLRLKPEWLWQDPLPTLAAARRDATPKL
jgi:Uncharacterized protein conserved in cyanobacteria